MFFPTLGAIATRDVVHVPCDTTVAEAVAKMQSHNHRDIIIKSLAFYYVFTTQDIIRLKLDNIPFDKTFADLQLRRVPLLNKNENIITALELLKNDSDYICVSNDDGELYGLVTNNDIIASVDPQIMVENLTLGSMIERRFSFVSCERTLPTREAIRAMYDARTDCIIATDEGSPVGILTSKDILRFVNSEAASETPLEHYMTTPLMTLKLDKNIKEALEFVKTFAFKRIVVEDGDGNIAGIISEQELVSRTYLKWSHLVKEHFNEFEELMDVLNQKNRQLAQMATRDALTGINNRHMFEQLFEKSWASAKRYVRPLSLLIMDIDHFKSVNDTYGHNIGDEVLRHLAEFINCRIRGADIFARWGGEEFVLLLPDTDIDQAIQAAEKLRTDLANERFERVGSITASFGVTTVESENMVKELEKADQALYKAKKEGRNRVLSF